MKEIRTEIEINETAEKVWNVLTSFDSFPDWNPFIKRIEGELKIGAQLKVYMEPPCGKGMTFKPIIKKVNPNVELRWLGRLILLGIFDGEHIFEIEKIDGTKVRFIHRENFSGVLVPLFWKQLNTVTRRGFELMNKSLKERIEAK
jgi:hypothetical protein